MKDKHELITLNEKAWWSGLLGILKYQGKLMRSVYRSEEQMHNEHKLITQDENAWWQVRLESSKFQENLMRCFRATVNRVITRFPKETEVTNRETDKFADQANVGKSLLDWNKDHLLNQARSELMKQEHQVGSHNSCIDEFLQQAYAHRLELEDAHHGFFEIAKRTITPARRINYEGKALRETPDTKFSRDGRNEESSRITSRRILRTKIERKSWDNTKAHFTNAGNARADEFYEWFRWILRSGIESQWEIVLRSQSTSSDSRFLFHAEPRQTLATWHVEYVWTVVKRSCNQFSTADSSRNHYQRIHHSLTPGDTRSVPVHTCTRTLVAIDEDRSKGTIPMSTLARRPSTTKFISSSGYSAEFYGWTAKTAEIGTAIRHIPCALPHSYVWR